jgi:hypothetical protein
MISGSILLIFAIGISVLLLITVVFAVTVYSAPDKLTKEVSLSCHDRILGYARMGAYPDATTVKAAMAPVAALQEYE